MTQLSDIYKRTQLYGQALYIVSQKQSIRESDNHMLLLNLMIELNKEVLTYLELLQKNYNEISSKTWADFISNCNDQSSGIENLINTIRLYNALIVNEINDADAFASLISLIFQYACVISSWLLLIAAFVVIALTPPTFVVAGLIAMFGLISGSLTLSKVSSSIQIGQNVDEVVKQATKIQNGTHQVRSENGLDKKKTVFLDFFVQNLPDSKSLAQIVDDEYNRLSTGR